MFNALAAAVDRAAQSFRNLSASAQAKQSADQAKNLARAVERKLAPELIAALRKELK